jgi:hypothetical protein
VRRADHAIPEGGETSKISEKSKSFLFLILKELFQFPVERPIEV